MAGPCSRRNFKARRLGWSRECEIQVRLRFVVSARSGNPDFGQPWRALFGSGRFRHGCRRLDGWRGSSFCAVRLPGGNSDDLGSKMQRNRNRQARQGRDQLSSRTCRRPCGKATRHGDRRASRPDACQIRWPSHEVAGSRAACELTKRASSKIVRDCIRLSRRTDAQLSPCGSLGVAVAWPKDRR